MNILGIKIDNYTQPRILEKIKNALNGGVFAYAVTLNPEIILKAVHDEEYFYILNKADISATDGIGLKLAGWLCGANLARVAGADLLWPIFGLLHREKSRVLVVNWQGGLSSDQDIEAMLKSRYPGLDLMVRGAQKGREAWEELWNSRELIEFRPQALICLFGAPDQEKFLYHSSSRFASLRFGIGLGGAMDFATGAIRRAPKAMRSLGLEWLWRLAKQPHRIGRIYNAVIKFPASFLRWRFILPLLYRPNVACLLYKKEGGRVFVFLVERADEPGHWQIPQGGTDGQDLRTAGERELREETNCDKFAFKACYKNLHKYGFGQRGEGVNYARSQQKHLGYKGQSQSLYIAQFTGQDSDIRVNFWEHSNWRWEPIETLVNAVHPCRREAVKMYIDRLVKM